MSFYKPRIAAIVCHICAKSASGTCDRCHRLVCSTHSVLIHPPTLSDLTIFTQSGLVVSEDTLLCKECYALTLRILAIEAKHQEEIQKALHIDHEKYEAEKRWEHRNCLVIMVIIFMLFYLGCHFG